MGLFNHHQRHSSSSTSMDPHSSIQTPSSRSSSSSAHSVHSSHSTSTIRPDGPRPTSSTAALAYAVGMQADHPHHPSRLYEHTDIDMTDAANPGGTWVYHAPRHPPPVPPARTSSLSHGERTAPLTGSASLPTVSLTHATPTKKRGLRHHAAESSSEALSTSPTHGRGSRIGHGTLNVTEDELFTSDGKINVAYLSQEARLRKENEDDSDGDRQAAVRVQQEKFKKERTREQGRKRQAKKRERDKKAREEAKAGLSINPNPESSQHSTFTSRNASTASLGPLSTPNFSATTPDSRASTSTSTIYSSLPNSASMVSLSPAASPYSHPSQQVSGASSPNTMFSPMTSTIGSMTAIEQQAWSLPKTYASRSAVDVRLMPTAGSTSSPRRLTQDEIRDSSASLSMTLDQQQPLLTSPAVVVSPSGQTHPAKRRRSEPEPELFKKSAEVGLGVMGIIENEQEPIEYLDSPAKSSLHSGGDQLYLKERPGIRRTASDSAAITLDFSQPHSQSHSQLHAENRSPTPPPLAPFHSAHDKSSHVIAPPTPTQEGEWFAETVITAMTCSEHSAVQSTMSQLEIGLEDLRFIASDLAACYQKLKQYKLEKKMKEISLNDPAKHVSVTSTITSVATTPLQESAPLSTTSTSSSSPTASRVDLSRDLPRSLPNALSLPVGKSLSQSITLRPATITPKTSTVPSRARSLSSASLRARGIKLGSKTARSPTLVRPQPDPLVSPMSSTSFHFPNTPSFHPLPESDGASPMMSSVQTPVTGQSAYFDHEDIDAAMNLNANQAGYGGIGGHLRSATDPMGSKMYSTRQQHSIPGYHPSGSSTGVSDVYNRASASSSALSSPVDMSFHTRHHSLSSSFGHAHQMPVPPPHQYPPMPISDVTHSSDAGLTFNSRGQTPSSQQRSRHQYTYSHPTSAGAPCTPTGQVHRSSQSDVNVWQPNITPIPEQGTPTRPSSHQATPMMMDDHQHSNATGIRQGGLDHAMLSPQPPGAPVPLPLQGEWPNFSGAQPNQIGAQGNDPFMLPYQNQPRHT